MEHVLADHASVRLRRPARLLCLASDERLVALVRAGEEGAFEALYDRHHPAILGFCRHMLGTREEAEDAVQHTFLAAFRDLAGSEKPIELRPWLFAIARNRCLSLLRARRQHVAIEQAEPATDGLAATVERREDVRELLADLASLPEDQRAALLLAELGALDHAGIATVLGCPREKVKALVFQARASLAASREARATPCDEIRLELATASGAALRRGPLRRHLRGCDSCRAFKAEVAMQRKLLAVALPVVPTIALKATILSGGAGATSSGGAAAATATTAGTASGALSGVLGTVASTSAGKLAVSLAVAGMVAGGTLSERLAQHSSAASPPSYAPLDSVLSGPATQRDPLFMPGRSSHAGVSDRPNRHAPASGQTDVRSTDAGATPSVATPGDAPHPRLVQAPAQTEPASHGTADRGATPPGQERAPTTPPDQSRAPSAPPGQAKVPSPPPPGQARAPSAPPGQEKTPTAPPRQSGPPNSPPGQSGAAAPGQSGSAPGPSSTGPGQSGADRGQSGAPAGQSGSAPGRSGDGPGRSGSAPGRDR